MAKPSNSKEIRIQRVYDAPLKAVWDAWCDPEQAKHWWGPRGFTLTHHSKDLRPGGIWHYTMHGPDGTDWVNKTQASSRCKGWKWIAQRPRRRLFCF